MRQPFSLPLNRHTVHRCTIPYAEEVSDGLPANHTETGGGPAGTHQADTEILWRCRQRLSDRHIDPDSEIAKLIVKAHDADTAKPLVLLRDFHIHIRERIDHIY